LDKNGYDRLKGDPSTSLGERNLETAQTRKWQITKLAHGLQPGGKRKTASKQGQKILPGKRPDTVGGGDTAPSKGGSINRKTGLKRGYLPTKKSTKNPCSGGGKVVFPSREDIFQTNHKNTSRRNVRHVFQLRNGEKFHHHQKGESL